MKTNFVFIAICLAFVQCENVIENKDIGKLGPQTRIPNKTQIQELIDNKLKELREQGFNDYKFDNIELPINNEEHGIRSRPVINVEGRVIFHSNKKQISLEEKNCSLSRDKYVSCTTLEACVKYNGVGVRDRIDLIVEFILDAKKTKDPRMFLYPEIDRKHKFNETWTLRRNDEYCKRMQVYIRDNTRDKLTPLEVEMWYSLQQRQRRDAQIYRNPRNDLLPVLNGNLPSTFKDSIVIKKNCGDDDVCIPDLRLFVTPNVDKYLLGSGKRLKIDVKVMNEGEDSFESMFYMKVPPGINFFNTEQVDGSQVKCSAPSESTNNTLKCDIGNPLPAARLVHFRVLLDPYTVEGMKASYDFSIKTNSTNPEDNSTVSDNVQNFSVEIWVKTNISLTGWAQNPDIHYKEDTYKSENYTSETEIGPQIVHTYSVKNNGPSDINEADVLFMWTSQTLEGDDLLYLMEQPELQGKISCEFVSDVNPLKAELLSKKYYLDASISESSKLSGQGRMTSEERRNSSSTTGQDGVTRFSETENRGGQNINKYDIIYTSTGNQQGNQSSSVNGGPVQTWSRNSLSTTGQDGVTRFSETENRGGQNINNYDIIYTSTGNQQGNQSSSVNGGPVQTWSRNSSSTTGQDGVTRFSETENRGGQNINNYDIIYTSTGNQQGNQSSSVNGGPVQTWSRNSSSTTGQDGVTRFSETENRGGQNINNYDIIYTSTGNQQGNQFTNGHNQQGHTNRSFSVSQQSNLGQYDANGVQIQNRMHGRQDYGTVHQTQRGQQDKHSYFNWDDSRDSGTSYGTIRTHTQTGKDQTGSGSSGSISGDGEMVYSQTGGSVSGSGEMVYSGRGQSGHVYGQTHGHSTGQIHGQTYGQSSGQSHGQSSGQSHGQSSGQSHGQSSGQTYGQSHGQSSGQTYGQSHGQSSGQTYGQSSGQSHGQSYGQGFRQNQGQTQQGTVVYNSGSGQGAGSTYREFTRLSGYNLTGLISEEDLRRMIQHGSGEFTNGTHVIRWRTEHGGFKIQNDTSRPFAISTEESVNQNIDEYTRRITQGGYDQSHRSQGGRHQSGGRDRSTYGQYDQSEVDTSQGIGGAALGGGFRTTSLDLGVLNKQDNNKDYGSTYYDPDLDSYEDRSSEGQSGVSYGTSRTSSSGRQNTGSRHHESSGSSYSYSQNHGSRNYVGDNVPTDRPLDTDYRNRLYRSRRQVDDDISDIIQCRSAKCSVIRCKSGPLVKDEEAFAALRFRANAATLKKIGWNEVVTVSSMMVSRINKLPYIGTPLDRPVHTHEVFTNVTNIGWNEVVTVSSMMVSRINKLPYIGTPLDRPVHTHEVFTNVTLTETEIKPDVIPLWIVVLSACAGAIILLLLIFLLYKCGFFKRNRPSHAPERQPLNRNGHYIGDEQL